MPKPLRGKNAKRIPNWRGTCPLCGRTRVKVLWNVIQNGAAVKTCKRCSAQARNAAFH